MDALARALNPTTRRHIEQFRLAAGAHCLEVGAGSGSVAAWLADRFGKHGRVVALDLDTRWLLPRAAEHSNLEVMQGDVFAASLGDSAYDLVHARLVFGHLADRKRALARLIHATRPGGWLLLEEVDFMWTDVGMQPICPERYCEPYIRVWKAAVAYMKERGFDGHWGRHLAPFLREAGLRDVAGEASMLIGDSDLTLAMRLTVGRLGPALIEGGSVSVKALANFDASWGSRRPLYRLSDVFGLGPTSRSRLHRRAMNARDSGWLLSGAPHVWRPYCQMKTAPGPLPVSRTQGARIVLDDGRELIDGTASWWTACHGYNHPHIRQAVQAQLERAPHVMFGGLAHEPAYRLAARLAKLLPGDLDHVFFAESGSVAIEIALKMALQYWMNRGVSGRTRFVSFWAATTATHSRP